MKMSGKHENRRLNFKGNRSQSVHLNVASATFLPACFSSRALVKPGKTFFILLTWFSRKLNFRILDVQIS